MSFQFKVVVFMVASVGIVWVSWPSLRNFRFHGFYRFFAWEAILVSVEGGQATVERIESHAESHFRPSGGWHFRGSVSIKRAKSGRAPQTPVS